MHLMLVEYPERHGTYHPGPKVICAESHNLSLLDRDVIRYSITPPPRPPTLNSRDFPPSLLFFFLHHEHGQCQSHL
jgi:hypothetical protein